MNALKNGYAEVVELLMKHEGTDIDIQDILNLKNL